GAYATLVDLQAAFPNGDNHIYVVTADGNWYYWDGSAWTAGGIYQSSGIADKSVTPDKTTFLIPSTNLLDKSIFIDDYTFDSSTGEPTENSSFGLSDFIKVKPNTMYFFKNILKIGRYDANKNYLSQYSPTGLGEAVNSFNAEYIRVVAYKHLYNVAQINEGEEELPYEPY